MALMIVGARCSGGTATALQATLPQPDAEGKSSWILGATITAVELPTAFPYFAAIAAIVGAGTRARARVVLLVMFNLCFVLPLIAIVLDALDRRRRRRGGARSGRGLPAGALAGDAGGAALVARPVRHHARRHRASRSTTAGSAGSRGGCASSMHVSLTRPASTAGLTGLRDALDQSAARAFLTAAACRSATAPAERP